MNVNSPAVTFTMVRTSSGFALINSVSLEISSAAFSAPCVNVGNSASPSAICRPSNADFSRVTLPSKLSSLICAMRSAAPAALLTESDSFLKSASLAFTIASIPAKDSFPKMAVAAATCSDSESPPKLDRRLSMTSRNVFMLPSAFVRLIPYLSM